MAAEPPSGSGLPIRRCFICLMDEGEGDNTSEWVNPCPCTLEAHQDCIMAWVADCERENKPLKCPVCKAALQVEGPWDPAIEFSNWLRRKMNRLSPPILLSMISTGTVASLGIYGITALQVFAGRDAPIQYLYQSSGRMRYNILRLSLMPLVAPALVLGQTFPRQTNRLSLPIFGIYSTYLLSKDPSLLSWPPTPQIAFSIFPYVREAYHALYWELFGKMERRWENIILGIPEPDPQAADAAPQPRNDGIRGMILNFLDVLNGPDVELDLRVVVEDREVEDHDGEVAIEMGLVEEDRLPGDAAVIEVDLVPADDRQAEGEPRLEEENGPLEVDEEQVQQQLEDQPLAEPDRQGNGGLRGTLRELSSHVVTALLYPGIAWGMGELLRLTLPRSWTTLAKLNSGSLWPRVSYVRTGLLQEQWGRSLVGGCVFTVLRDAFRLYVKYRGAATKPLRRIKNVERARRTN